MSVTNDWGQGAVNNTIDWGKGKTTATNNWGKIYDSSASGDTTLASASTPFTNTYSVNFDGFNDCVSMGNVLDFANDGTQAFTFSCWFKTTDTSTQVFLGKQLNTTPFNGYNFSLSSNTIGFFLGSTSLNARIQGKTAALSSVTDGNWHHVAFTYDGSQNISGFKIYYDNTTPSITTTFNNTPSGVSNAAEFMAGARGTTSSVGAAFAGNLDEIAYFSSELSASNIDTIYGTGVPNDISGLNPVGWWRMGDNDDGTGSTVTDQGSGGNNGTLTNSPTFQEDVPN